MHSSESSIGIKKENILVIKRDVLINTVGMHGIIASNIDQLFEIIAIHGSYMERDKAETNEEYKQIIPYLVYQYKNKFFLMKRSAKAGEVRLKNLYTLGIGGHIRESDLSNSRNVLDWAEREFFEEVNFSGTYKPIFLGLLNDDSNPVGRVHLGLVFLLIGNTPRISVKTELENGALMTLPEIILLNDSLESWSQITLDYLVKLYEQNDISQQISLSC